MKVWLDDVRTPPEGWVWAKNYDEAVALLVQGDVSVISLDHDLGMAETSRVGEISIATEDAAAKTGYDVACWIENHIVQGGFNPPVIRCHSANPVGKMRIEQAIASIGNLSFIGLQGNL